MMRGGVGRASLSLPAKRGLGVSLRHPVWDKFTHYYSFGRFTQYSDLIGSQDLYIGDGQAISSTINSITQNGISLTNTSIQCPTHSSFNVGQHSIIVGFEHNNTTNFVYPGIVAKRQGDISNFEYSLLLIDTNDASRNKLSYQVCASGDHRNGYAQTPSTGAISANTPVFVHAYYDGSKIGVSINNGTEYTTNYTGSIYSGTSNFEVGGRGHNSSSRLSASKFYFVGLTNSPLTADEINYIYNGGQWRRMPLRIIT